MARGFVMVHNFSHQGITGEEVLWASGLCDPARYYDSERLRHDFNPAALNLLKGAIVYSNFVTTVSPGHAWEVCYCDQGRGLGQQHACPRQQVRRGAQRR